MADLRRLELLRQAVAEAPAKLFNMARWTSTMKCATAYCAAGWYVAKHGEAEGLRFVDGRIAKRNDCVEFGFTGLARHFGITLDEAGWLFAPLKYVGRFGRIRRGTVLARIDSLIGQYANAMFPDPAEPSVIFQGIKTEGDGPAGTYRAECGESAYAMAAVKVAEAVEVEMA